MHSLLKHPLVDADVEDAAFWYHLRDPETAVRFVDETREAMFSAAKSPLQFSIRFDDVRRVRLRQFPHSVYFLVYHHAVFIIAVLHGAREVEKLILERKAHT
jgi:plasmid stabilization system protein ParE